MAGPAPKPASQRRRRNAPERGEWITLPEAHEMETPRWPLSGRTPAGWVEMWRTPQSYVWEMQGSATVFLVARYLMLRTELSDPTNDISGVVGFWSELRQMEDRLGLNPTSMKALRWNVGEMDAADGKGTADKDADVVDIAARRKLITGG